MIESRARRGGSSRGLDIWQHDDRTTKMLCMVWSDVVFVSYRGGPWEKAIARAAAGVTMRQRMEMLRKMDASVFEVLNGAIAGDFEGDPAQFRRGRQTLSVGAI